LSSSKSRFVSSGTHLTDENTAELFTLSTYASDEIESSTGAVSSAACGDRQPANGNSRTAGKNSGLNRFMENKIVFIVF
jgi:hypothetical protein